MESMRVRSGNERLAKALSDFDRTPVRIEKAAPEMTELDRIETVEPIQELFPDGTAENVERMRGDREERRPPTRS